MSSLFSLDSPFMRFMSRVADLLLLNFFFLLTSIPIFTIGASAAAMYTVCFRFGTEREDGTVKSYFRAFKENFRQATGLWLILLLVMVTAFLNAVFFYSLGGLLHLLWIVFAALLVLAVFVTTYAFPLLSQFENRNKQTFKNALILSIAYLPRSLVMGALNILPFALVLARLDLFLQAGFIWFILYFGGVAFLNSLMLKKVFRPFWNREEADSAAGTPAPAIEENKPEEVSK